MGIPLYGQNKDGNALGNATGEVKRISSNLSLTANDSGGTYIMDAALTVDLPAPKAGLEFTFICGTTASTDMIIEATSDGAAGSDIGYVVGDVGGTAYSAGPKDIFTFGASSNNHTIGDKLHLICDGTYWYGTVLAKVASSFTLD